MDGFFAQVTGLADARGLLSKDHFSVDGTLIRANYRKSHNTAAVLCYQGHVSMENRNGLVVSAVVTHADGHGERLAALAMLDALPTAGRRSLGADKAYDTADFVGACRERKVTPHIACHDTRRGGSAIDGRTTRHPTYRLPNCSQTD